MGTASAATGIMENSKTTKRVLYLLFLMCTVICKISGDVAADGGFDSDDVVDSDINSLLSHHVSPRLELVLRRSVSNILKANPYLSKYVSQTDPEQAESQQTRNKRLAGLENLDLMTGIFARLPMRTNAALSDLQERMRVHGRK